MKILIDIGHPAHVHYFRNFIKIMESRGHQFLITARDKEVTHTLLNYFNITYINRGRGGKTLIGKILYIIIGDYKILKAALKFKPNLFLSFASSYAAHVAVLTRKPHIAFDDTEHAKFEHWMYVPFTKTILTPTCFTKDFGKKQVRFNGYMELCSLHPKYYTPSLEILKVLNLNGYNNYILIRFVSWGASHDLGIKGINIEVKRQLIRKLSKYVKVFISSENELPSEFEKYRFPVPPEKMHDMLSNAFFYIGEGATIASECAVLGTPAIYVNKLKVGYCTEQEKKYGLLLNMHDSKDLIDRVLRLIENKNLKEEWQKCREKMLSEKIDVTAFMVWFIENYPNSVKVMKDNPDYQYNFR